MEVAGDEQGKGWSVIAVGAKGWSVTERLERRAIFTEGWSVRSVLEKVGALLLCAKRLERRGVRTNAPTFSLIMTMEGRKTASPTRS